MNSEGLARLWSDLANSWAPALQSTGASAEQLGGFAGVQPSRSCGIRAEGAGSEQGRAHPPRVLGLCWV